MNEQIRPTDRIGDFMQIVSGKAFWPMDPRPEEIFVEDIASSLSKQCRYGGHCLQFYSVAEHCVLAAEMAPEEFKLATLLHDASEAYLQDIVRPVKYHLTNYIAIESALEKVIAKRFGLAWPMPPEVKSIDERMIADERLQANAKSELVWDRWKEVPPLGVSLQFWDPPKAKNQFIAAFNRYGGKEL